MHTKGSQGGSETFGEIERDNLRAEVQTWKSKAEQSNHKITQILTQHESELTSVKNQHQS